MGWEERNGKFYYYKKEWANGTCVSQYVGTGPVANLAHFESLERRINQEAENQEFQEFWQEFDLEEKKIDEIFASIRSLVSSRLLATGYHCHRGQWRKRRKSKK